MSSSPSFHKFDVFLSFRGSDTGKTLVSHLYRSLDRNGIRTFKVAREPETGKEFSPGLLQAIKESKSAIVVMSKNYGASSWCLEELVEILELQTEGLLRVIPIFYGLTTSNVREQTGKLDQHFRAHEKSETPEKVQQWRKVLQALAELQGLYSDDWEDDAKLVEEITKTICRWLFPTTSSNSSDLVGIDGRTEAVRRLLDLNSNNEVRVIGIWGTRGIGKSTLARHVYSKISQHFQTHCFLENVKQVSRYRGLAGLREEFLSNIQGEALVMKSSHVGSEVIEARLRKQRVLLVADAVDSIEQLNALAEDFNSFGPGSRIIIATRDKELLVACGVKHLYETERLDSNEARELFRLCASGQSIPVLLYDDLSSITVQLAGHLPLTIKVLGSLLSDRNRKEWKRLVHTFQRYFSSRGIIDINQISFDGIDEKDKSNTGNVPSRLIATTSSSFNVLVGMDTHIKAVDRMLDLESNSEVRIIGIWGIGGVGKTALAKYVYEETSRYFHTHVFLENVNKIWQTHGPSRLREEFLSKGVEGEALTMKSFQMDSDVIRLSLGHRKVLLIADGVDTTEQLEVMAKDARWFGPGSRVIVTTRDERVLVACGVEHVYEVKCLRFDEALQLFYHFAFKQKHPSNRFKELSVRAVQLVGFLPLALKIFGSSLYGRDEKYWDFALQKLEASQSR